MSINIGKFKEVMDFVKGGLGYSFCDFIVDKVGVELVDFVIFNDFNVCCVQEVLVGIDSESQFIFLFYDLLEGFSEEIFVSVFGIELDLRYQEMEVWIDGCIQVLFVYFSDML